MNTVAELVEKFCWASKTRSVWKDDPDLLDDAMARIHSEAAVFDAIIRSKNTTVPSMEKISRTVKFLEQNSFWRSNPFSLVAGAEDDPALVRATSRLQMKRIRDLWEQTSVPKSETDAKVLLNRSDIEAKPDIIGNPSELESSTSNLAFASNCDLNNNGEMHLSKLHFPTSNHQFVDNGCFQFAGDTTSGLRTYAEAARGVP